MISVPEASWASRMTSIEEYLPVRTISTLSPSDSVTAAYVALGVISRLTATAVYSRLTLSRVSRPSTVSPGSTSTGLPLTLIVTDTNGRSPLLGCGRQSVRRRVPFAGITRIRFEGSRAAPGSQDSSPHDDGRKYTPALCALSPAAPCSPGDSAPGGRWNQQRDRRRARANRDDSRSGAPRP